MESSLAARSVALRVNGIDRSLQLEARVFLLDALRENLGLTGTKKGCNQGACGACTVLVDGERINSCFALAIQYEGRNITTKEVLALAKKDKNSLLAGSHFDDVRACDSGLFRRDRREVGETYVAILSRLNQNFVEAESESGPPLETLKYSMGSYGAQFCEIRVKRVREGTDFMVP